jgi:hypothetical protein
MPLKRCTHWATREFHQFLLTHEKTPFAWGTNDCCLFPANAIHSFTGHDLASDFRDKYSNEEEAFALIQSLTGGTTVEDAAAWCAHKAGLVERPAPLFAQRGDLVVIENGGSVIAGVVHLNGRHVISVGHGGLMRLSLRSVTRAWKV